MGTVVKRSCTPSGGAVGVDLHLEQGDARAYEEQVVNVLYCRSAERAELGGQCPMAMEEFLCPSVAMAHDSEEDVDLD